MNKKIENTSSDEPNDQALARAGKSENYAQDAGGALPAAPCSPTIVSAQKQGDKIRVVGLQLDEGGVMITEPMLNLINLAWNGITGPVWNVNLGEWENYPAESNTE